MKRSILDDVLHAPSYLICAAAVILVLGPTVPAQGQGASLLTRHTREAVSSGEATLIGRLPANQTLKLNLALPLRNEAELDDLLQRLYDPRSPEYHQYLSVEQFTERFGPTREDYTAVLRFAEENGLKVTGTSANRLLVDVSGSVENIERAFHVAMGEYRHPTEPRTFFAPDAEPKADLAIALWHVTGLDNYSRPHPADLRHANGAISARPLTTGSGPGGAFIGSDMRAAYYGGSALTGAGQSVGLLEFLGYNQADVTTYFSQVHQTLGVAVVGVSTDVGSPGTELEFAL